MSNIEIKGYYVPSGYMGWIGFDYMLFASEDDYLTYLED